MGFLSIVVIAVGLAMDAFAVAICKGLSMKKMNWRKGLIVGGYFGFFQALMPLIGYLLGVGFQEKVTGVDHWIVFILLGTIGINMIKEALSKEEECKNDNVNFKEMVVLAIATSIDALAVGMTMAFLEVKIITAVLVIGIITFIISVIGVKIGNIFGDKYEKKSEFIGGVILILMGLKILLEHLGVISL